jgi:hypothetical protein
MKGDNIKLTDLEIQYWYEWCEKYKKSDLPKTKFSEKNNLDSKKFTSIYNRFNFISESNPELYKEYKKIHEEYLNSDLGATQFFKNHGLDRSRMIQICTHFSYLKRIRQIKESSKDTSNLFIEIPKKLPEQLSVQLPVIVQETEVVEKQNDIEIQISKGVKVSIAPNIDSMKIIKIIELLKDL